MRMPKTVLDCPCTISVAVAKTHDVCVVTLAQKNLIMGTLQKDDRIWMHGFPSHPDRILPDEAQVLNVNLMRLSRFLKADIGLVDGTVGLQGNGPGGTDVVDLGAAAASADVFAVDAVMSKAMGFEPMQLGALTLCRCVGNGSGRSGTYRSCRCAYRGRCAVVFTARNDRGPAQVARNRSGAIPTEMNSRPNILWICTDQQRYDTIGALGYHHVDTPHIDGLVSEGVTFTRAYCQSPICTPSRGSFLTGMYPSAIHVTGNGNDAFPSAPSLVSKRLSDAGYDCGLIGKLHLASAYGRIEPRVDDGYRYWDASHAPRDDWPVGHGYADWVRQRGGVLGELTGDPQGVPAEFHQTTWCAEKTIEFMQEDREGPWMACVNIYDPHPPFNPPQRYRDLFDPADMPGPLFRQSDIEQQEKLAGVDFQSSVRSPDALDIRDPLQPERGRAADGRVLQAAYCAMIKLIDDQVGRMLAALEASGQRENTVVIFTSDHGEMLGDHGLIQKGCRFYEGLVRVPLISPGRVTLPKTCAAMLW